MWTPTSTEGGMTTWTDGRGSRLSLPVGQRPPEQGPALHQPPSPLSRTTLPPWELHELLSAKHFLDWAIECYQRGPEQWAAMGHGLPLLRNALNQSFGGDPCSEAWALTDPISLTPEVKRQLEILSSMGTRLLTLLERYRHDPHVAPELFQPFLSIRDRLNAAFPPAVRIKQVVLEALVPSATSLAKDPAEVDTTSEKESEVEHSRCTVCPLPAETRTGMREKLNAGEPLRSVAAQFNVSPSSLFRHKQHAATEG